MKVMEKVSITIPAGTLRAADKLMQRQGLNRSELFRQAVEVYLRLLEERELAEGYAAMSEQNRQMAEEHLGVVREILAD